MEFFYRDMRRRHGLLMDGEEPAGGHWNFDAENRKPLPKRSRPEPPLRFAPDAITREVIAISSARRFADHFGDLEPFGWPVTRGRRAARRSTISSSDRLADFGDYQDAMKPGEPFLFHAVLSP